MCDAINWWRMTYKGIVSRSQSVLYSQSPIADVDQTITKHKLTNYKLFWKIADFAGHDCCFFLPFDSETNGLFYTASIDLSNNKKAEKSDHDQKCTECGQLLDIFMKFCHFHSEI